MKVKLTTPGWFVMFGFLILSILTGFLVKLIVVVVLIKIIRTGLAGAFNNITNVPRKDKPKIPFPLAQKLAKRQNEHNTPKS